MSKIKELKTIITHKKLSETTYLCVQIMNSKRQVYCKGETWSRGANLRLLLDVTWCLTSLIDLFNLYVLFSQYRSCNNTLENCFFQISSCSRAYVRTKRQSVKFPGTAIGKTKHTTQRGLYLAIQCNTKTRGGYSTNLYTGKLLPEDQPLTLYIPFFTKKVPLPFNRCKCTVF